MIHLIYHSPNAALIPTPVEKWCMPINNQGEALDDGTNVGINVGINVGTNVGENERKILSIIAHTPGR